MKAKTRVRIIFLTLTALAVGFPLLFLTAPPVPHPLGPEVIAVSFDATQDSLFIEGKLFFSNKHRIIRHINLVLVNREGRWLVDCHDNNIF